MFNYRPEIDGLRALAIIPVIFFHAGFEHFQGGFIGVDVFFVISGYLISSIILKEVSTGTFTLKNFYERRARRILPALFLVVFASIPLALLWMPPADMLDFSQSLISIPLFFSNFLFYYESGYFDSAMEIKPLFHTWSLAVEEQFYMLFPLLIIFLWKFKTKKISIIISILFVVSLIAAELLVNSNKMIAFFMLFTRAWELLLGFGVAFIEFNRVKPIYSVFFRNMLSFIGLFLISYSVMYFDKNTPVPGLYALIPTIGTSLIIAFSYNTYVSRLLSNRLFVGIGLISYSAYLWHQPIFAFLRIYRFGDDKFGMLISAILITFLLSFLTWKFIEKPFRSRDAINLKNALLSFFISGSLLVSIGFLGVFSNGFEGLYKSRLTGPERVFFKNAKEISELRNNEVNEVNFSECFIEYSDTSAFHDSFDSCSDKYGSAIVLMGDSHMNNVKRSLSKIDKYEFIVSITGYHCHPYHYFDKDSISTCKFGDIAKFIELNHLKISLLIYNQLGSYFLRDKDGDTLNHKNVSYVSNNIMRVDSSRIRKILEYFDQSLNKVPVIWLSSWIEPRYPMNNPRRMVQYNISNLEYIPNVVTMFNNIDKEVNKLITSSLSNVMYVELFDSNSKENFIPIIKNDCVVFNDKDHLSSCGENLAGSIFNRKIYNTLEINNLSGILKQ